MTDVAVGRFDDGEAYERLMGRWSRVAGSEFLEWCAQPQGLRWLDVGCGNGAFTEEIAARAAPAAVTGIDPAAVHVAYARDRLPHSNISFQVGDALNLPFPEASFDAAAMGLVIAFVPDPAKAVAEMKRVVKPGGLVAAYMWDLPNGGVHLAPFFRALKDMDMPGPLPPNARVSTHDNLKALWKDAGLKNVETRIISITTTFKDFEDYWQSNTTRLGPLAERLNTMTPDQLDALQQRLKVMLPAAADGTISCGAVANAVKGKA